MDVESAFFDGKVKSEVDVKQPQDYDDNSGRVCKVNKALYGLRESPRTWYESLQGEAQGSGSRIRLKLWHSFVDIEI